MPVILSLVLLAARSASRAAGAFAAATVRRAARFIHVVQNRRTSAALARLDDRLLADIGLTRSDLREAFAEPLWRDPTEVLERRASERRQGRSGGTVEVPPLAPAGLACCPRTADHPAGLPM